jgi:DNA-directed RNA polymerase subunit RPC12/RpoP
VPIVVPSSSLSPFPPQIDGEHIPQAEQPAVAHLLGLLFMLGWYEWQLRHALTLFDLCEQENADLSAQRNINDLPRYPIISATWHTLSAWNTMAARDGAISIYHFGQALSAIPSWLWTCPTIRARLDHDAIRLARRAFVAALPSYDAIRHAVGHAADFNATIQERERHSIMPPLQWGTLHVSGTRPVRFTEQLVGRAYCVSYQGRMHSYEIRSETAEVLGRARERVYAAFDAVRDSDFYQCPYCGHRDLQEVYGRCVYRCADCDRLETNEEFWRARAIRARRASIQRICSIIDRRRRALERAQALNE